MTGRQPDDETVDQGGGLTAGSSSLVVRVGRLLGFNLLSIDFPNQFQTGHPCDDTLSEKTFILIDQNYPGRSLTHKFLNIVLNQGDYHHQHSRHHKENQQTGPIAPDQ